MYNNLEFWGLFCHCCFLFDDYKLKYQAVMFLNRFLIHETVIVHDNLHLYWIMSNFNTVAQSNTAHVFSMCWKRSFKTWTAWIIVVFNTQCRLSDSSCPPVNGGIQHGISCNLESDSHLVIKELECLELQLTISIFGSRFIKIYFLDLLFSRAHILRGLFNI